MKNFNHSGNGNLLLLMSGSIACEKASTLISQWRQRGGHVKVVCSRNVSEFIAVSTLQDLGAEMVFDDVFAEGQAMEHIALGQWADLILVAPATSNLINKLAAGIADDAVTTVWQAAYGLNKPMLIAPAMNTRMWQYPATQASVQRLQQWGIRILPVGEGELACGEMGEGRLLEPAEILKSIDAETGLRVDHNHGTQNARGIEPGTRPERDAKRILITAGGTREPIDSVRYIGNISSGRTASALADEMSLAGHDVTWLGAEDAVRPEQPCNVETYISFKDLRAQLQKLLACERFDAVIHAAAVSDFSVATVVAATTNEVEEANVVTEANKVAELSKPFKIENKESCAAGKGGKLSSDVDLVMQLQRNPKLLDSLRGWSLNPAIKVIGFKLTDTDDLDKRQTAVDRQFERSGVDAVVLNDLSEITGSTHTFELFGKNSLRESNVKPRHCKNAQELANNLNDLLQVTS